MWRMGSRQTNKRSKVLAPSGNTTEDRNTRRVSQRSARRPQVMRQTGNKFLCFVNATSVSIFPGKKKKSTEKVALIFNSRIVYTTNKIIRVRKNMNYLLKIRGAIIRQQILH